MDGFGGEFGMSYKEVAALLGVCTRTVRRMVDRGDFPKPMRVGLKRIVFRSSEVERMLPLFKKGVRT